MPSPRVFISSTCHDLQEIRFHLRRFVSEMGYDPVMSDFGDIFYDFDEHVQDACRREIERCQLFVLLIGNRYGNLYHRHQDGATDLPDSITLQEFRKALNVGVPKFIFINRFVLHDFDNFRRSLANHLTKYFDEHEVADDQVATVRGEQREVFERRYPFPQSSYRFMFRFLDVIHGLKKNNAIFPFETVDEVRDTLRRQWASFMHEALSRDGTVAPSVLTEMRGKLERIEHQMRLLTEGTQRHDQSGKVTIDVRQLIADMDLEDLEATQSRIQETLNEILWAYGRPRIKFHERYTSETVKEWLDGLEDLIRRFKWSSEIPVTEVFTGVDYTWYKNRADVPFRALLELHGVYRGLEEEDREYFANTVEVRLNETFEEKVDEPNDDLPF